MGLALQSVVATLPAFAFPNFAHDEPVRHLLPTFKQVQRLTPLGRDCSLPPPHTHTHTSLPHAPVGHYAVSPLQGLRLRQILNIKAG